MTWKAEEKRTRRFNKTDELPINEGLNEYIFFFFKKTEVITELGSTNVIKFPKKFMIFTPVATPAVPPYS